MKSRTIRYGERGGVELIEVDVPDPGPGQVQIEGLACGICAWDIYTYANGGHGLPGHEGLGRIVRVGEGIGHLKEGMRVTGHGLGFADYANHPAGCVIPIPEQDTRPDEHWIVEPVSCVVTGLDHAQVKAADRVAVVGCGFMGLLLIQGLARTMAERVIAIDIDDRKLELAKQFGATDVYNSSSEDFTTQEEELKALGIDTVIDCTGAQEGLFLSSRLAKRGGRLVLFGWNHGLTQFPGNLWHMHGLTVVNATPSAAVADPFGRAIRLMHRGLLDLEPVVTHVVGLDEYPDLLKTAAERGDGYIKGVVRLN